MKRTTVFTLLLLFLAYNAFSTTWVTIADGNWNNPSIWSTDGGFTSCACVPPTPINSGNTVIVNHDLILNTHIGVGGGATLNVNSSGSLYGPTSNLGVYGNGVANIHGAATFQKLITGATNGSNPGTINTYNTLIQVTSEITIYAGAININGGFIYMPSGNFIVKPNGTMNINDGSKLELFGGNIKNEGEIFICDECCLTTSGNWTIESSGEVSGGGAATATGGNMKNFGVWSPQLTWCSDGNDTGMPTPEDCSTSTTTCGLVMLPIELSFFTADAHNQGIDIVWETTSERNCERFDLLRSNDGMNWEKCYSTPASGNSTEISTYFFRDVDMYSGVNYYRLEQYDFDGTITFSAPISVHFEQKMQGIRAYPNPNQAQNVFWISGITKSGTITLFTQNGQEIESYSVENPTTHQRIEKLLNAGVYYIQFICDSEVTQTKLVVR